MGCYSFGDPDGPVSFALHGGPGPLCPTVYGGLERLLGGDFYHLTKILTVFY